MSISALMVAVTEARKQSRVDDSRTVEIVLTEEGFVVRGQCWVKPTWDQPPIRCAFSTELGWPEFDARPELLLNSVLLVGRDIDAKEAEYAG